MHSAQRRVRLTRRVEFSAAHRYQRDDWSEEKNRAVFGENVDLHGHNYVLEATVEGGVDPETGMAADLGALDRELGGIARDLGWRDLSGRDTPGLAGRIPTTENLALLAWDRLHGKLGEAALVRVRVFESPELYAEVEAPGDGRRP